MWSTAKYISYKRTKESSYTRKILLLLRQTNPFFCLKNKKRQQIISKICYEEGSVAAALIPAGNGLFESV